MVGIMSELSDHTKLMNIFICLANKNRVCTPVLFNNHYTIETIELQFNKQDSRKIHSDIALINPQVNNLLLLECKDGRLQNDQCERYKTLNQKDIVTAGITTLSGNFTFEVSYAGTQEKKDVLIQDIKNNTCNFPVLICDDYKVKLEHNNFNCKVLQNIFSTNGGIDIPNPVPLFYYPFGTDDSEAHILSWIGPTLIKLRGQCFNIDDILKATHQCFNYIDNESLGNIKSRLFNILKKISKNDMNEFFDLPPSDAQFKLKDFGVKKFQTSINNCVNKSDKEVSKETQKAMSEYFK